MEGWGGRMLDAHHYKISFLPTQACDFSISLSMIDSLLSFLYKTNLDILRSV